MKRTCIILILLFTLFTLGGCNDDVFVSREGLPEYTYVSLAGDGGNWSAMYSRTGLTGITIKVPYDERKYLTYRDSPGKPTDENCPPEELGSIIYDNPLRYFSINFAEHWIYIYSGYNAGEEKEVSLILEYHGDVTKEIVLDISAGKPLNTWVNYKGEMELEEDFESITFQDSFTNNSSLTQVFNVYPYERVHCSDEVTTDESWTIGQVVDMPMPAYFFSLGWELLSEGSVTIGVTRNVKTPYYPDRELKVEVPANKKITVTYTLHYTKATQRGTIEFYNTISNSMTEVGFTASAAYPTSYTYIVTYE